MFVIRIFVVVIIVVGWFAACDHKNTPDATFSLFASSFPAAVDRQAGSK